MGQGFSLTTLSAGSAGIDVPELSDLVYEKSMGTARFMKSIRARHQDGVVLVKVIVKPYAMKLEKYKRSIISKSIVYFQEIAANMHLQRNERLWQMCQTLLRTSG
jgi:hypothetical protein